MSQLGFNPNVLMRELAKAGLKGQVDADAFRALLQFYQDVQGDKESLYSVFTALKEGEQAGVAVLCLLAAGSCTAQDSVQCCRGCSEAGPSHNMIVLCVAKPECGLPAPCYSKHRLTP